MIKVLALAISLNVSSPVILKHFCGERAETSFVHNLKGAGFYEYVFTQNGRTVCNAGDKYKFLIFGRNFRIFISKAPRTLISRKVSGLARKYQWGMEERRVRLGFLNKFLNQIGGVGRPMAPENLPIMPNIVRGRLPLVGEVPVPNYLTSVSIPAAPASPHWWLDRCSGLQDYF